jgi:hypothetical protein
MLDRTFAVDYGGDRLAAEWTPETLAADRIECQVDMPSAELVG